MENKFQSYPEGQLEPAGGLLRLEVRVLGEDDLVDGLTGVPLPDDVQMKSWLSTEPHIAIQKRSSYLLAPSSTMASLIMTEIAWAGGAGGSLFSSGGHLVTLRGVWFGLVGTMDRVSPV